MQSEVCPTQGHPVKEARHAQPRYVEREGERKGGREGGRGGRE